MKNIILTLFAATILFGAKAQISVEAVYPQGSSNLFGHLHLVRLTSGDKYCQFYSSSFVLYNLNHTVFRTVNFPTLPSGSNLNYIYFVTDALFDQNPADVEFMVIYNTPSMSNFANMGIYRENGTLLFHRDSVMPPPNTVYMEDMIFKTSAGTKMILSRPSQIGGDAFVLALPGNLPCRECGIGPLQVESNNGQGSTGVGSPYPNPAADHTTIPYALPEGERTGWLVLFDLAGKEVKRMQITNTFTSVLLSTEDVAAGTYSYRIESGQKVLPGEKLIIIHQ